MCLQPVKSVDQIQSQLSLLSVCNPLSSQSAARHHQSVQLSTRQHGNEQRPTITSLDTEHHQQSAPNSTTAGPQVFVSSHSLVNHMTGVLSETSLSSVITPTRATGSCLPPPSSGTERPQTAPSKADHSPPAITVDASLSSSTSKVGYI